MNKNIKKKKMVLKRALLIKILFNNFKGLMQLYHYILLMVAFVLSSLVCWPFYKTAKEYSWSNISKTEGFLLSLNKNDYTNSNLIDKLWLILIQTLIEILNNKLNHLKGLSKTNDSFSYSKEFRVCKFYGFMDKKLVKAYDIVEQVSLNDLITLKDKSYYKSELKVFSDVCGHYNVVCGEGDHIFISTLTSKSNSFNVLLPKTADFKKIEVANVWDNQYISRCVYHVDNSLKPYLSDIPKNDTFYDKFKGNSKFFNKDENANYALFSNRVLNNFLESSQSNNLINMNDYALSSLLEVGPSINKLISIKNDSEL